MSASLSPFRRNDADLLTYPSALLAGGFGRAGEFTHNDRPLEIAAVVPSNTDAIGSDPYFQRRFPASPPPGKAQSFEKDLDIEGGSQERPDSLSKGYDEEGPVGESLPLLRYIAELAR